MPSPVRPLMTIGANEHPNPSTRTWIWGSTISLGDKVDLVQNKRFGFLREGLGIFAKFPADRPVVRHRIGTVEWHDIDDMHDPVRPLDVPKKIMSETCSLRCTLDQSGDIGDQQPTMVWQLGYSQVWGQGGERVVGNLWTRS